MGKSESLPTTLVTRFSALGDVAMTLPLLYNVARSNPDRHFLLLTRKHAAGMFINAPANLEVIGVDLEQRGGPRDILTMCRRIVSEYNIDSYADLHDVLRTKLMRLAMRLRGVPSAHINKCRRQRRALTRANGKNLVQLTPVHRLYADVFERLGIFRDRSFISLFGPDGAPDAALRPILGPDVSKDDEIWIAVAPFARHAGKIYPPDRMRKVVEHFASRPGTRIFLFGAGAEEREILDDWAKGNPRMVNMASLRKGLPYELAMLSRCDVLISMDSANMHLASLVGCPVVSVWGATHPYTGFYGRGQSPDNAVQLALPCRPCSIYGNKACRRGDYLCLRGITPEMIIARVCRVCAIND